MGPLHDLTPAEFWALLESADPSEQPALLRERFRTHIDEFCRYCWPDQFDASFNALHDSLFEGQLVPGWKERRDRGMTLRRAVAAPRGFAKSTIKSFGAIVHDIVYDRESFIVIISATSDQSHLLSKRLRAAIQDEDSNLARLYGPLKVKGGIEAWEVSVNGRPPVEVASKSYGTEIRGIISSRGNRPSKFVIDDGEKKDRVRNPEQRSLWWEWLTKDVLKAGDRRGGTIFDWVGTVLHQDAVLARLLRDPGWSPRRWQAIISWPTASAQALWEKCRAIWIDAASFGERRRDLARAFYRRWQREMDEGAKVLDPDTKSLFELYEQIWAEGLSAFLQEMQNDPVDPSAQVFYSERFAKFTVDGEWLIILGQDGRPNGRRVKWVDLRKVGKWDTATGTPGGDFAAIAILARDTLGYTYVLDCWMQRAKPSVQLEVAWRLSERWHCKRIVLEGNGFQSLVGEPYLRQREERLASNQYAGMVLDTCTESENKELRIAALEPDVANGWLLFSDRISPEVFGQFDQFPTADHDDGPDAIEGGWDELGGRSPQMR